MTHRVKTRQTILFHTRDAVDVLGTIAAQRGDTEESEVLRASILDKSRFIDMNSNFAHPMAGPVYIEGAEPGDVLKVTIISIDPGEYGYTFGSGGFIRDLMEGQFLAIWRLNKEFAVSDDIPNVRIPNASFPGIVSTLPGRPIANDTAPRTAARRCGRTSYVTGFQQSDALDNLRP